MHLLSQHLPAPGRLPLSRKAPRSSARRETRTALYITAHAPSLSPHQDRLSAQQPAAQPRAANSMLPPTSTSRRSSLEAAVGASRSISSRGSVSAPGLILVSPQHDHRHGNQGHAAVTRPSAISAPEDIPPSLPSGNRHHRIDTPQSTQQIGGPRRDAPYVARSFRAEHGPRQRGFGHSEPATRRRSPASIPADVWIVRGAAQKI